MGILIGIFHNTSGLITRGLGEAHKLLTRGLGPSKKIIKGESPKVLRTKEYIFDITSGVSKTNLIKKRIYTLVRRIFNKTIQLKSNVSKEVSKSLELKTKTSKKRLIEMLEAI